MIQIDVENSSDTPCSFTENIQTWATAALHAEGRQKGNVAIMILDAAAMQTLNQQFRQKDKPTNVLSFPSRQPAFIDPPFLGDIALCTPVIEQEAHAQQKSLDAHFAHLTVHGILHLLGYDHQTEADAQGMEAKEIAILQTLGFPDPYLTEIIHD